AADDIADALGALGTPVEEMELLGEGLDGIVVAKVLDLRPHPNADRMQLVDVDPGTGEALQVCCGAFNMAVGDLVPLATVGTVMPNGMEIARAKKRGEWSNGMLCSPTELGMGSDGSGIMVLDSALVGAAGLGTPLKEALGVEADVLYDLEINPNRPDAMSVAGVARDLAAWYRVPFTLPSPALVETGDPVSGLITVEVEDRTRCGRFTARVLQGVTVGPSAPAITRRLTLLGMRPINNVVDVSNYVMLELGQPSHPYDLARIPGGGLRVRRAGDGETLLTLDDVERRLTADDLLICDANDAPNGLAGIMGGASSEIDETTRDVLVEMAWFLPIGIAKTARRLGLRSEASARFEKGTDPEVIELAHARFVELLGNAVTSVATGMVDVRGELPQRAPVRVRTARVNRILGTQLDGPTIGSLIEPIGFTSEPVGDDQDVTIPSWRYDSSAEIDVIEEVARLYGYANIPKVVPPAVRFGALSVRQRERREVRDVLVGLGLAEALPMPFLAPGDLVRSGLRDAPITITNPLVAEESVLRTSLLPGLLKTLAYNQSHRASDFGLFELGHVFRRPATEQPLPDEREHVGVLLADAEAPAAVDVWEALADALAVADWSLRAAEVPGMHPTRTAEVVVAGEVLGAVGEVDPGVLEAHGITGRAAWLELDLGRLLDLPHGERPYRPVSRFPSSDIDLAFEVPDSVPAAELERILRSAAGDLLVDLRIFDVYRGPGVAAGSRSLGFRLRFQAPDRTLTDADVAAVRERAIDAVQASLPVQLRG
ncbi:MAG: phenylalanyl-tRNA synthetase beta chain, partial [Acidimicrobiaceae bacterium]